MLTIKEFSKKYNLTIIPVSDETITFGKCVWDSLVFGKPKFSHPGMPDYIYNAFVSSGILTEAESNILLHQNRTTPLVNAGIANIEFESDVAIELGIDSKIGIEAESKVKKIQRFVFSDVKAKILTESARFQMFKNLELLKDEHWEDYKRGLRNAYVITKLYYADVKIYINTQQSAELNLEAGGLVLSPGESTERTKTFIFKNTTVPFAMALEKIKHLEF
jgi:hypothetical protein